MYLNVLYLLLSGKKNYIIFIYCHNKILRKIKKLLSTDFYSKKKIYIYIIYTTRNESTYFLYIILIKLFKCVFIKNCITY